MPSPSLQQRREPLLLPDADWRSRWLVLPSWRRLHRIAEIEWSPEWNAPAQMIAGEGVAVCGARGFYRMPGIISRMGLTRCAHCCLALGIPRGDGQPGNASAVPWRHA